LQQEEMLIWVYGFKKGEDSVWRDIYGTFELDDDYY